MENEKKYAVLNAELLCNHLIVFCELRKLKFSRKVAAKKREIGY